LKTSSSGDTPDDGIRDSGSVNPEAGGVGKYKATLFTCSSVAEVGRTGAPATDLLTGYRVPTIRP
jgi:hypothetical protein